MNVYRVGCFSPSDCARMRNTKYKIENAEGRSGMQQKGDDLLERLLNFVARVGKVVDALPDTRMGRHVAGQLVRCGTSPAPNYAEACGAESRKDFVHKIGICLKELRESRCWLRLTIKSKLLSESRMAKVGDECEP